MIGVSQFKFNSAIRMMILGRLLKASPVQRLRSKTVSQPMMKSLCRFDSTLVA